MSDKCKVAYGGYSQSVDLLELVASPPLTNGFSIWCGRISKPTQVSLDVSLGCTITLSDGRSSNVTIVTNGNNSGDLTFYGIFT